MDKVFETKERNQAILDMTRKLWYPLCVTFDHYCQTSISEREIGHKSAPYSEIYQFFICLATPEATCACFLHYISNTAPIVASWIFPKII